MSQDPSNQASEPQSASPATSETAVATPAAEEASGPREEGLGAKVRVGASWTTLGVLANKSLTIISQVVLGYLLSDGDFGVYAMAIAAAGLVRILQNGGSRDYLVKRGREAYPKLAMPAFTYSMLFNVFAAGSMILLAPMAARFYGEPEVASLMIIIALSMPLQTSAVMFRIKLQVDLRYKEMSAIVVGSGFCRYGATILLAYLGFGAQSFAWPLLLVALYENVHGYVATRDRFWLYSRVRDSRREWGTIFRATRWLLFGSFANLLVLQGDYLISGRFVSAEILGVYYFAYALLGQGVTLLVMNLQSLLLPALSRLEGEPERLRVAVLRTMRVLLLIAVPLSMGLGTVYAPLEQLVWGGKWAVSTEPLRVLALVYFLPLTAGFTYAVLVSGGRYKRWSLLTLIEGVLVVAGGAVGAKYDGTPLGIAVCVASAILIGRSMTLAVTARTVGVRKRDIGDTVLRPWVFGLAGYGLGLVAIDAATAHVPAGRLGETMLFVIGGAVFTLAYGVLMRVLASQHIRDFLTIVPARLRPMASRLALVKPT